VTAKYIRLSLIISHNTSDGYLDLPIAGVSVRPVYTTFASMLQEGNSIILFIDSVLMFNYLAPF
jgi:hypothetical protein